MDLLRFSVTIYSTFLSTVLSLASSSMLVLVTKNGQACIAFGNMMFFTLDLLPTAMKMERNTSSTESARRMISLFSSLQVKLRPADLRLTKWYTTSKLLRYFTITPPRSPMIRLPSCLRCFLGEEQHRPTITQGDASLASTALSPQPFAATDALTHHLPDHRHTGILHSITAMFTTCSNPSPLSFNVP